MKFRKVLAVLAAGVTTVALAVSASAANTAFLMFADSAWAWGNWNPGDCAAGDTTVNGDGTYTVFVDKSIEGAYNEEGELLTAVGAVVFNVDIIDLAADLGLTWDEELSNAENNPGITVSGVSITTYSADGTSKSIAVDDSKLVYGDIEAKGTFRIELYNEYGLTKDNPPVDISAIGFDDKISVTFTISGIGGGNVTPDGDGASEVGGDDGAEPVIPISAPVGDKESVDTGVEGLAVICALAVISAGAVAVSRKRK